MSAPDYNGPWGTLTGIRPAKIARGLLDLGYSADKVADVFVNTYNTDICSAALVCEVAECAGALLAKAYRDGISLYIGIPFCPSRCAYCSFVSYSLDKYDMLMEPYLDALEKETAATGAIAEKLNSRIETVYIGGGTPTTLTAPQLERLFGMIYREFDLSHIREFSVEAGRPDTITDDKLAVMLKYNVTRLSINPQSMNAGVLEKIGRRHTPDEIISAYNLVRQYPFAVNMDIIAGLPGESCESFRNGLDKIIQLAPENITVHAMTLKRASVINQSAGNYELTDKREVGKMRDYAYGSLRENGYFPYYLYKQKYTLGGYENTGYSKPGYECLYNIYMMEETQTILSLGGGGATKLVKGNRIERIFNVKEATEYIGRIDEMIERKGRIMDVLNTLKDNFSKTAKVAVKKSNEFVEWTKLSIAVSNLKSSIEKNFVTIGQKVYDSRKEESDDSAEIIALCDEIDVMTAEIEAKQEEILKIRKLKACVDCGREISSESNFCSHCGSKSV